VALGARHGSALQRLFRPCCRGLLWAILLLPCALSCGRGATRALLVATTTSLDDSGLFSVLLPAFERAQPGVRVRLLAVGSGQALALGRSRDADVLVVHAPADELAFMEAGHGTGRWSVMENDFVIVGPRADPAGVRGGRDAIEALRRLALQRATWASRGDSSGTHRTEQRLLRDAGLDTRSGMQVLDVGQGMAETLVLAAEREAYTLTDRATYVTLRHTLGLDVLVEGDPRLRNVYSVITVRGANNRADASAFAAWLRSVDARRLVADYGQARYGTSLFTPLLPEQANNGSVSR
jgi:tungstate transport system substrate-binding protein